MRQIKVLFITLEIACIICVVFLEFTEVSEDGEFFKSMYISLMAICAIVFEREQSLIEWEEEL